MTNFKSYVVKHQLQLSFAIKKINWLEKSTVFSATKQSCLQKLKLNRLEINFRSQLMKKPQFKHCGKIERNSRGLKV